MQKKSGSGAKTPALQDRQPRLADLEELLSDTMQGAKNLLQIARAWGNEEDA
ncbi:MAG: hypothetical protein HOC74_41005 [Gemmatimonadetes bacterium]|jgi:hypothetical protein|nr:hypothetical protein [Gemmatimonadota bacterium]MBT7913116.1 hypothetical protein [Candidatus Bathyarchaeota archaeon]